MPFHAFRVVYIVKEMDYHAKHGQSKKKTIWTYKFHFHVHKSFRDFLYIMALADVNDGGIPYMGISPGRTRPCTHRPGTRARPSTRFIRLHGTRSGRVL